MLHQHLRASDALAQRACRTLFPDRAMLTVPRTACMPSGQCYQNVRQTVAIRKGTPRCGWVLTVWPGRFVEAIFHAVWETPHGTLEDVTDRPFPCVRGNETTFIPEPVIALDPLYDPNLPSEFLILDDDPDTKLLVYLTKQRVRALGAIQDYLRKNNIPFHRDTAGKIVATATPEQGRILTFLSLQESRFYKQKHALTERLVASSSMNEFSQVARNDRCPCGSGMKYKRCHGAMPLAAKAARDSIVGGITQR